MSFFQPAIVVSGYAGWRVLEKTTVNQRETFEKSPSLLRNIEYFSENIQKATTAEALVKDHRLLSVALGAFGLGDEIDKRAFVQRILESNVADTESFAVRLNEPRFQALSKAFGYGSIGGAKVALFSFRDDIIARYKSLEFERAVGEVDNDMRLAMNFKREIATIAASENVDRSGWFQVMGQLPLRSLLVKALGLPDAISQLDVGRQKEIFEQKALSLYGSKSPAIFNDPANVEHAVRRFFLFRQMENGPSMSTPAAAALTLLQNQALGGGAIVNILQSQI